MKAIECSHISKSFKKKQALKNVSLTLEKGTITGLLGRNGAGKSTLLNILADRLFADEGQVLVDGTKAANNMDIQERLFLMSEADVYAADLKSQKIIALTEDLRPDFSASEALRIADLFELPLKKRYSGLSTGMKTMLKLTLALASGADYLLFDEPTLGLDANNRDLFYRLLLEKHAEYQPAIVLSTHLIEEVENLIDHVVILDQGEVTDAGPLDQILDGLVTLTGPSLALETWARDQGLEVLERSSFGGQGRYLLKLNGRPVPDHFLSRPLTLQEHFLYRTRTEPEGGLL